MKDTAKPVCAIIKPDRLKTLLSVVAKQAFFILSGKKFLILLELSAVSSGII